VTIEWALRNWALLIASVLGTAILLFVLYRLYEASPRGRLGVGVRNLRLQKLAAQKAEQRLAKASTRLSRLQGRAASIKPRLIAEADEAVQDATALKRIADDQVLIAIKQVRQVIVEEFPPNRHDVMRTKYL
jgi:hypothetical protein